MVYNAQKNREAYFIVNDLQDCLAMNYQLAQLNIAKFQLPMEHPDNADFVNNLDRVNAIAESQPGFIWRLVGEGNNAMDVQAFSDPDIITNMSVWADMESLAAFVYRNEEHRAIMRRRREWFEKMAFFMVLWWVPANHTPSLEEAKTRLELLRKHGATAQAFTFREPFPMPGGEQPDPVIDQCA